MTPAGGKHWRFRYRVNGKQKKLALGPYPEITLADARERTFEARRDVLNGGDPALERKKYQKLTKARDGATFASVAQEYIDKMMVGNGRAEATIQKANYFLSRLEVAIGSMPLNEIQATDMLKALKRIEAKGQYETTKKCRSFASRVFRYGVATMRCDNDPTSVLKGALISPRPKHHAAILDPYKLGSFMRTVEIYGGALSTQYTLLVLPHVFTRPGELRLAKWPEIDLENAIWRIPAERMKQRRPHIVPLSSQVVGYLTEMAHIWGTEAYLLPSEQTWKKPLSENTVNQAFRRLGFSKD